MTKEQFFKDNHLNYDEFLSHSGRKVYTNSSYSNNVICIEEMVSEAYSLTKHLKLFNQGLCIQCGKERKPYSDFYIHTKISDSTVLHIYEYENGYCRKCAQKNSGTEKIRSYGNDDFIQERVSGIKDNVITHYFAEGWPRSIDPIYDIDHEKVEGFETVSNDQLKWSGQDN